MKEKFQRRDILQSSTATVLGLPAFSENVLSLTTEQPKNRDETEHTIPYDLSIINNSTEKVTFNVELVPKSFDGPSFETGFSLLSLNEPGVDNVDLTWKRRKLDVENEGTYTAYFSRKDGSMASTDVRVSERGIAEAEAITVYVKPSGGVTANTVIR